MLARQAPCLDSGVKDAWRGEDIIVRYLSDGCRMFMYLSQQRVSFMLSKCGTLKAASQSQECQHVLHNCSFQELSL